MRKSAVGRWIRICSAGPRLVLPWIIAFFPPALACADVIRLRTFAEPYVSNGIAMVDLDIANYGDERACSFQAAAHFLDEQGHSGPLVESLEPLASLRQTIAVGPAPRQNGLHPIVIRLRYADASGYPCSIVSATLLETGEFAEDESIEGHVASVNLPGGDFLDVRLTAPREPSVDVHLSLVTPDEIRAVPRARNCVVACAQTNAIRFALSAPQARPKSRYAIYAVAVYENNGVRLASLFPGTVSIDGRASFFARHYRYWIVFALALALLAVAVEYAGRTSRHSRAEAR